MSNKLAKAISLIFHPVFLSFYVTLILIFSHRFSFPFESISQKLMVSGAILFLSTILPCLFMVTLKRSKVIESYEMNTTKERWMPYLLNCLIYTLIVLVLHHNFQNSFLEQFFLGMLILQIIIFIINFFWKISIHATGIGAVTGFFAQLCINMPIFWMIVVALLILSGLIIYARLKLKAHSNMQIATGWLLGFLVMYCLGFFIV